MIITITRTLLIHCEGIKIDTVMTYTHWLCLWPEGSFYYQILTDHTCVRALISNYKLCLMLDVLHTIHVTVTLVFADRRWSQCTDESSHPTMLCGSNYLSIPRIQWWLRWSLINEAPRFWQYALSDYIGHHQSKWITRFQWELFTQFTLAANCFCDVIVAGTIVLELWSRLNSVIPYKYKRMKT